MIKYTFQFHRAVAKFPLVLFYRANDEIRLSYFIERMIQPAYLGLLEANDEIRLYKAIRKTARGVFIYSDVSRFVLSYL